MKKHIGIFVPGLGNSNKMLEWAVSRMTSPNFLGVIYDPQWEAGAEDFIHKRDELSDMVMLYRNKGYNVSLISSSAGGTLALTVFNNLRNDVTAAIAISSCLKTDITTQTLENNFERFPAHHSAVVFFEKEVEPKLSVDQRARIMTMRPYYDNVVPLSAMTIPGTKDRRVLMGLHGLGIATALTFYSNFIVNFIQREK